MFDQETVFILGAGASWHYGYPTGEDLVRRVIKKSNRFLSDLDSGHSTRRDHLGLPTAKYYNEELPQFQFNFSREEMKESCRLLSQRLSQTNTLVIDYFLSQQSERIQEIGKFFIAWVILECECQYFSGVVRQGNNNCNRNRLSVDRDKPLEKYNDDWCRFLLHKIVSGCERQDSEACADGKSLCSNKVKFITFNYDVSLEQSILKGLQALSDHFEEGEIKDFLSEDRFIHMYGKIRDDFYLQDFSGTFKPIEVGLNGGSANLRAIYQASLSIRTIEDVDKENEVFNKAQLAIQKAKQVCVLGFGFDNRNCDRLGLSQLSALKSQDVSVSFTNYGDSDLINKKANRLFDLNGFFYRGGQNLLPKGRLSVLKNRGAIRNSYERSTVDVYRALAEDIEL